MKNQRVCVRAGSLLRGVLLLGLFAGLSAQGNAQQPAPPAATSPSQPADAAPGQAGDGQKTFTLKVNTQLVQLDVVVRNAKGEIVRGLTKSDFSVFEDNVAQPVVAFDITTPGAASVSKVAGVDSTAELDRRAPEAPVTIVVLDELSTSFGDEYFARYSLEKYLSKQGQVLDQPMMLVARTISRTLVLSDYTTSKKKILDALNHHLVGNDWRANNANYNDVQIAAAFASLLEVAKATQGHSGHKNLVWIGRGFPTLQWADLQPEQVQGLQDAVASCVDLLRQARITLYVIDPGGVQAPSGTSDENGVVTLDDPFDQSAGFDSLAKATGGTSMHGRNDVDHLIDDAVSNGESFYTLAYRPSSPEQGTPSKFRTIRVALKDPTLTAISRQGYYPAVAQAPPPSDTGKNTGEDNLVELASASSGLMVFDGIPLTLVRQGPGLKDVKISFPAAALGLTEADNKLTGDVTVITLSYDKKGKVLDKSGRVVTLHLGASASGGTEQRQINVLSSLNLSLPIARVRIVVRSHTNGKIGADNLFLTDRNASQDPVTGVKPH